MEHKNLTSTLTMKNAATGEVVARIGTLGVIDHDKDIIRPWAIPAKGAKVLMSSYAHDTITAGQQPVGRGILAPVGGTLQFTGKLFMSTSRGRETHALLAELGTDSEWSSEWSFGFQVLKSEAPTPEERRQGAERVLTSLLPLEVSPVIRGAGISTGTLSVKHHHVETLNAIDGAEMARIAARVQERQRLLDIDATLEAPSVLAKSRDLITQYELRQIAYRAHDPRLKGEDMPRTLHRVFRWAVKRLRMDSTSYPAVRLVKRHDLPERTAGMYHAAHNAVEVLDDLCHEDQEKTVLHELIHASDPSLSEGEVIAMERRLYGEYCTTLGAH
jgi:hypothetical protein